MGLMDYLPDYYQGNTTMTELQEILTNQINFVASGKEAVINELFVNTAASLLSRYELIYGIDANLIINNSLRREKILAKVSGRGTTTKQMIEDVAASFANGEIEVIEDNVNYKFTIRFIGQVGYPPGIDNLVIAINEIKPAHLQLEFTIIYTQYQRACWFDPC